MGAAAVGGISGLSVVCIAIAGAVGFGPAAVTLSAATLLFGAYVVRRLWREP